jgi:phosphomethylpyrimidine synthase
LGLQNQPAEGFIATEEAEAGMAHMSKEFKQEGGEIYLPTT